MPVAYMQENGQLIYSAHMQTNNIRRSTAIQSIEAQYLPSCRDTMHEASTLMQLAGMYF